MSKVRNSNFVETVRLVGICLSIILFVVMLNSTVEAKDEPSAFLSGEALPAFSKTFNPDTILAGDQSTLFFTIDNSASGTIASSLAFTDTLPAGVVIAASPAPVVFCDAGQVTANGGASTITFTGGSVSAGGNCLVTVYVTSSVPGAHVNISGDLTSSAGNSGNATDTLTVLDFSDVGFSKAFTPDAIAPGTTTSLSFDIDNSVSEDGLTGLAFSDVLPSGITIATPANATTNCTNATLSAPDGGNTISLSGGELGGGSSCSVTLDVVGTATATNISSFLTSSAGNSRPAIATLTVYTAKPSFSKSFTPDTIGPGSTTSLRFDIDNTATITPAVGLAFNDVLPSGITIATPANATTDCTNGNISAPNGGGTISFNSGELTGNSACSVTVNVIGNATATNVSGDLTSSRGNSGPATATLTIDGELPGFSKVFAPNSILPNEISTLTFTVNNSTGSSQASNLAFTDTLPSGVVIASPPNASESCGAGGTLTAVAGQSTITYSGGFVDPESTCTMSVDVTSSVPGVYVNVSSNLTSDAGTSSTATDTLTVATSSDLGFSKTFTPDTIGPGSSSTLRFDINNSASATLVTDIAFVDNLPAGVTIATPATASTDCGSGILNAPAGGSTISLTDGHLGGNSTCSVTVNVTSSVVGAHVNTTGDLTSSTGNSGTATDTLTVATSHPGFSKSFVPSTIPLGSISRLTFTIDNSANPSGLATLNFSDSLPADMIIATPANAVTDCGGLLGHTFTAVAGTSSISLFANGFLPNFPALMAGSTCTVSVDVTTTRTGTFNNKSGALSFTSAAHPSSTSAGFATASLLVPVEFLNKVFLDDPVLPGGTVTLEFTIQNPSRTAAATGIAFDDPLPAGLTFSSLVSDDCGGTLDTATPSLLSYSGGSLPAEGSCTLSVLLNVPGGTAPGTYTNTTTAITAMIDGEGVTGNVATDELVVTLAPTISKEFLDNPVGAGGTTTLRFTITNNSTTMNLSNIAFEDVFADVLPTAATVPTNPVCNGGTASYVPFIPASGGSTAQPARLTVSGASLDPSASCTIDITLNVANDAAVGTYPNTTSGVTGLLDGTTAVEGVPATDDLNIVAGPTLNKAFTDDPAQPGGTVTLQFTLTHSEFAPGEATAVTFTDDLAATLSGLTATGLPLVDLCGSGNGTLTGSAGDTLLTIADITLVPGQVCTFSVVLDVPVAAAAGNYTNTTSEVSATVLGLGVTSNPATDDLRVGGLVLTKEFIDDPTIPGDTVTLRFTLDNQHPIDDATNISFTDNLSTALSGLAAEAPLPDTTTCGGSSSLSGTTSLTFAGGSLAAGTTCSFDVTVRVPAAAGAGSYNNVTSNVLATMGGSSFVGDPAIDNLTVIDGLFLTKTFTNDPVAPGGTVTLEFTVTNLSPTASATNITFTDDLDGILSGLAAVGLPANDVCGAGSQISGTGLLTLTGGNLAPGASCTFSVTLQLPANTGGVTAVTNTTSSIAGDLDGVSASGDPAVDQLKIRFLTLSKSFDGPSYPGGTAVLTFTINNLSATASSSGIKFSDNLAAVIPGLVAIGPLPTNPCGAGSQLTGSSTLLFTGGNLGPNTSCTFSVTVQVPVTAVPGNFLNTTSNLSVNDVKAADPATATLTIDALPELTVIKTVVNDNGGTAVAANFTMNISGTNVSNSSFPGDEAGTTVTMTPGSYEVTETNISGYEGTLSSDCVGAIAAGESKTCTVTNDDIAPQLTVIKEVVNDNGGTAVAANFTMNISGTNVSTSSFPGDTVGTTVTLDAGSYEVTENNLPGYTGTFSSDCVGAIALGESKTCTVTNNDNSAQLTVIKTVVNDNGGTAVAANFTMNISGTNVSTSSFPGDAVGTTVTLDAGSYEVTESSLPGYTGTFSSDCVGAIAVGESKTCTVTNDDTPPQLTVIKEVVNNNGGTAVAANFTMNISGTNVSTSSFPGDTVGTTVTLDAGSYEVTESNLPGYTGTFSSDCVGSIAAGESKTCTVTNVDSPAQLTVIKTVVNDNGGTAVAANFTMNISGTNVSTSSFPGDTVGTTVTLDAGSYEVTESNLPGYTGTFSSDCVGTIAAGESKTCTVTNDDVAPQLTVIKEVINDNGGTAVAANFTMNISGTNVSTSSFPGDTVGTTVTLDAGSYEVTENNLPGYTGTFSSDCVGAIVVGESKTCTVTNNDNPAQLTVIKEVINDNGGTAVAANFTMNISGTNVSTSSFPGDTVGTTVTLDVGSYEVTESNLPGYTGTFSSDCVGSIAAGESKTCTVTNDDVAPTVALTKIVVGGTATPNDFGLTIGGVAVNSGQVLAVDANTPIALNEAGAPGYRFDSFGGDNGCPTVLGGTITLDLGASIACSITNVETPDLTLSKDDGGSTVQPGGTIIYTLTYANVSSADALNVLITETVPAHTTFNAGASSVGWSCAHGDPAGTVCTNLLGTVSGNSGPAVLNFAVDVLAPADAGVNEISNDASIADDGTNGPDANPDDNDANDTTPLDAAPDLTLTKDDGGVIGIPNDVIVYTLSVTNNGNQGATGVTFSETVPNDTTFIAASSTLGWSCADGAPAGTVCTLTLPGELASGAFASVNFAVKVNDEFSSGVEGVVTNNASVADDGTNGEDQNPLDNEASTQTPISNLVYVSSSSNGQIAPDVPWYDDEDILVFDPRTNSWAMHFDGSDVLQGNLDGFLIMADGSILMTFEQTETIGNLGPVDDTDIVRFIPTSLGNTTAGSFEWFLDGSDVGLVSPNDAIVAIAGSPDGRVVVSTQGNTSNPGLVVGDEDLIIFNANNFGANSSGTWEMYFDGSDVNLEDEDLQCAWIDPKNNDLYLSPDSDLNQVPNFSAGRDDIFLFKPNSLGDNTTGTFDSIFFAGSLHGFTNENIDGCSIGIYSESLSCSAATAVAPTVAIEKVGTTAHLTWSDTPANSGGYTILRSTSPYSGYTVLQTVAPGVTTYDDVGAIGNSNPNYFYKVRGLNDCIAPSDDSNLVGEFDFAIVPGN